MAFFKPISILFFTIALSAVLSSGVPAVQAQGLGSTFKAGLEAAAPEELKGGTTDPGKIAGNIIGAAMGVLGAVLFAYLLYGGYKYMTAKGESEEVTKAISVIRNAIIGMVIIALAYAISAFVIDALATAVGGEPKPE